MQSRKFRTNCQTKTGFTSKSSICNSKSSNRLPTKRSRRTADSLSNGQQTLPGEIRREIPPPFLRLHISQFFFRSISPDDTFEVRLYRYQKPSQTNLFGYIFTHTEVWSTSSGEVDLVCFLLFAFVCVHSGLLNALLLASCRRSRVLVHGSARSRPSQLD